MGAVISLMYMMTKIGEYFYPNEEKEEPTVVNQNITINIGEYKSDYPYEYNLMEDHSNHKNNIYIKDAVADIENNLSCTIQMGGGLSIALTIHLHNVEKENRKKKASQEENQKEMSRIDKSKKKKIIVPK